MTDRVEILLATYNGELYLREQLESILNQDYENWIIRACDDASTDRSYEILEEYRERYPDKFIIEKNQQGFGSAKKNFMYLFGKSSQAYVMCCDQDDVWLSNKISLTLKKMKDVEEKNTPVLIHTDLKVVDADLNIMSESLFAHSNFRKKFGFHEVLIQNFVTGCTMMINRPLLDLINRIKDYEHVLMHDWLAAILATGAGKVGFVDRPTMLYRQHRINSVGAKKYGAALFWSKIKDARMRKSLIDTTMQAEEIAKVYKGVLHAENDQLMEQYAVLWKKNKFQRVWFYLRHGVMKKGLARKACQLIVG